jgi:hypothetical protein
MQRAVKKQELEEDEVVGSILLKSDEPSVRALDHTWHVQPLGELELFVKDVIWYQRSIRDTISCQRHCEACSVNFSVNNFR